VQGPLAETAGHFWLMAWEQSSKAILMLNKLIEKGQVGTCIITTDIVDNNNNIIIIIIIVIITGAKKE